MTNIETLLRQTIKTIDNNTNIDWDSTTAKVFKNIYDGYYIEKGNHTCICLHCQKETSFVFCDKSTKKIIFNYCDNCIMIFK